MVQHLHTRVKCDGSIIETARNLLFCCLSIFIPFVVTLAATLQENGQLINHNAQLDAAKEFFHR